MKLIEVLKESKFSPTGEGEIVYREGFGKEIKREKPLPVAKVGLNLPYRFLNPIQSLFYKFYEGGNALVAAPTSAGKTGIALLFFQNRKGRIVYTAPTKALVNEKAKELKAIFGKVDIRTGDIIEEFKPVTHRVVVSTYENLALALRNNSPWVEDIEALVVDEVHSLLGNRGAIVEEIITELLLRNIDLLALSATIPGAEKLASWLKASLFIKSDWRPVPLERKTLPLKDFKEWIDPKQLQEELKNDDRFALKMLTALFELTKLNEKVIVFVPKKSIGWKMLEFAHRERLNIANKTAPFEVEREGHEIAFHNADVPKEEREEIEKAFREGDLNILIATQTLAYGVNLPADKVLIGVKGFYDRNRKKVKIIPDELDILQEEGRAGRFGIKDKGYSYILTYGTKFAIVEKKVKGALEGEFKPHLQEELSQDQEGSLEKLVLFLLVALMHKGERFREFLKETYSLRKFVNHPKVDEAIQWLLLHGYIDGKYRPTEKGLFCLRSGLPPFKMEEFLRRKQLSLPTLVVIRPLLYTKRLDGIFFFAERADRFKEDLQRVSEMLLPCGQECFKDNTDQLLFFTEGLTFFYPNISNPPGDFSYLGSDALHLLRTLLELRSLGELSLTNRELLRITHSVKYGLKEEYAPLGGIKGIGHIRANLLKNYLKTEGIEGLEFGQKVSDILDPALGDEKTLKGDLTDLLIHLRNLSAPKAKREANTVVSLLKRNLSSHLVDDRILRTFGLFLFGRESLSWKRERLLNEILES